MNPEELTVYYKCNMSRLQHALAFIVCVAIGFVIGYLFYHRIVLSIPVGLIFGYFAERIFAESTVEKRQKALRAQFNDFLDSMAVAVRSGNVEYGAVKFALDDLKLSYSEESDIVREVSYIVFQYEKGGVKLTDLFQNLADRSGLEDIRNFAMVYSVIEGRSDRFGEVLMSTRDIISNKIEIESQIDATIISAKNETNTMLIMPIIIVVFMATIGKGMMDSLFTTLAGNLAATVALIIFGISYVLSVRAARIDL